MGVDWDQYKEAAAKNTPVRRIGQPADIANMVRFFCSEESGFVTGQTIYVRGGP
jgi:3-oxoacyl-[acyl-carrier protein] reductase